MRLIGYDALYQELLISKPAWIWANYDVDDVIKQVFDIVKAQPTIDALKHGHWIDCYYDVTCSVCGTEFYKDDYCYEAFEYCPNCGAKMDSQV